MSDWTDANTKHEGTQVVARLCYLVSTLSLKAVGEVEVSSGATRIG